ncbi:hypothetical protein, partial [Kitasatospora griseola]|uniref:hypothetical protein n=1 Tax=Kitasatospora griseola TaxID=2064 RepID=UPI0034153B39
RRRAAEADSRASQSEDKLTDLAVQLETDADAHRKTADALTGQVDRLHQEAAQRRRDLAAVRELLERAQAVQAAQGSADLAQLDLLREEARVQLAARDELITGLRTELEKTKADEQVPEHTVLKFRTAVGGLVVVTGEPDGCRDEAESDDRRCYHDYTWQCLACEQRSESYTYGLEPARRQANLHAGECRAETPARTATAN